METAQFPKMSNLVAPVTTPAIVIDGMIACHILHCAKWCNNLPFYTCKIWAKTWPKFTTKKVEKIAKRGLQIGQPVLSYHQTERQRRTAPNLDNGTQPNGKYLAQHRARGYRQRAQVITLSHTAHTCNLTTQ